MPRVNTYVFIDMETTGMPKEEFNKTRITELSMVAVKRVHLLDTRPGATPRVQHKLTMCFNPRKQVCDEATRVTGLCNDLLEHEPVFDRAVFEMISTFLNVLTKPVCLVAQNGLGFDFPILKNRLEKLEVSLFDDLLCADCYHGFYDILEKNKQILAEKKCNDLKRLLALTGVLWGCTNPFIRQGTRGLREVKGASLVGQAWAELVFLLGNWRYVVPWLVNQAGSLVYVAAVQRAPLSLAVPVANGLAFAWTALTGAATGLEEPLRRGSMLGIALIVAGTALCCLDKAS